MSRSIASLAVIAVLVCAVAGPAAADLTSDTEITYTVDIDGGLIHLSADLHLTNTTPNRREGNTVTRFYYDAIEIYVPDTATGVVASSDGRELDLDLTEPEDDPDAEGLLLAHIRFGRRVFYQQQFDLTLEYGLPGDPPRSDSIFRVNPAYFNFGVVGWGQPGHVTVSVVTPSEFSVVLDGAELQRSEGDGGTSIYTTEGIADLEDFFVNVRGWNDDALHEDELSIGEVSVSVRSWPDDPEWADDVVEAVESGLPELQGLVGLEWVSDEQLVISELLETNLAGYGGWYLVDEHEINIGEWVDPWLVLHELSHAWFNDGLFTERWINEGLAEEFSLRAVDRAGLDDAEWLRPTRVPFASPALTHLNEWVLPEEAGLEDFGEVDAYEQAGYDLSFWVVQEVTSELGPAGLAEVVAAADSDLIAYRGDVEPEVVAPDDDWRRFLDLLEEIGGSETATDLFAEFVTDEDLGRRTDVRAAYAALEEHGDEWAPPLYVRSAMSQWEFDEAEDRIAEAETVLESRDTIIDNYEDIGVTPPSRLETTYESETEDLEEIHALAEQVLSATVATLDARAAATAEPTFVASVGLLGEDLHLEYGDVRDALEDDAYPEVAVEAAEVEALVAAAPVTGRNRLLLAGAALMVVTGLAVLLVRRRHTRGGLREGPESEPRADAAASGTDEP